MAILIIEDDDAIRELLTQVLEDEAYAVAGFRDGVQALEWLESCGELPCLILLDLTMPRMSGWQFRKEQQARPRIAAIPVVLLSARTDLVGPAADLTVDEYLPKPVDLDTLVETVRRFC